MKALLGVAFAVISLASITACAAPPKDVSKLLEPIVQKRDVPGMSATVVRNGEIVAIGVAGVRTRE
jgi:CubicO group peptidase (beta-lactamase class C family)